MTAPITVHGRLTRDPDLKFANSGTAVANLGIAVNERIRNKNTGAYEDGEVSFFNAVAFGQMAEAVAESLSRGDLVVASGIMKQKSWEKDGEKKTSFEITLDDIGKSLKWLDKPKENRREYDDSQVPF